MYLIIVIKSSKKKKKNFLAFLSFHGVINLNLLSLMIVLLIYIYRERESIPYISSPARHLLPPFTVVAR